MARVLILIAFRIIFCWVYLILLFLFFQPPGSNTLYRHLPGMFCLCLLNFLFRCLLLARKEASARCLFIAASSNLFFANLFLFLQLEFFLNFLLNSSFEGCRLKYGLSDIFFCAFSFSSLSHYAFGFTPQCRFDADIRVHVVMCKSRMTSTHASLYGN